MGLGAAGHPPEAPRLQPKLLPTRRSLLQLRARLPQPSLTGCSSCDSVKASPLKAPAGPEMVYDGCVLSGGSVAAVAKRGRWQKAAKLINCPSDVSVVA